MSPSQKHVLTRDRRVSAAKRRWLEQRQLEIEARARAATERAQRVKPARRRVRPAKPFKPAAQPTMVEPLTVFAVLDGGFVKIAAVGRFAIPEGPLEQELGGIADQIRTVASWRNRESA